MKAQAMLRCIGLTRKLLMNIKIIQSELLRYVLHEQIGDPTKSAGQFPMIEKVTVPT